jgi:putative restriction endonuclease
MQYYVGVTDNSWFRFLSERNPDEVNFWRPGGGQSFKAIPPGAPFLFKLHAPHNFIAGAGFFIRYGVLPLSIAWDAFREKNGTSSRDELLRKINEYKGGFSPDPAIGCIVLSEPVFLKQADWVPIPSEWKMNIVSGKTYDTSESVGGALWDEVRTRLVAYSAGMEDLLTPRAAVQGAEGFGAAYLTRARLGQGAFRVLVTEAYNHRCAVTGEKTLPVLQAAHIKPFAEDGPNRVENGILLRSDLHILFDKGYVTVTPDLRVKVSKAIREQYANGRDYYALDDRPLITRPDRTIELPSRDFLEWHNKKVFVA